jgi:DNA uptake protein ComE-like DNA-binding protein
VRPYGAEVSYYQRADFPYEPRNAPMRTITELELVAGTDPEIVREEDWDLDAQLDPDERDGRISWPVDNADDTLEAGWSERLTCASVDGAALAASGDELIDLTLAGATDLTSRLGVESAQAEAIIAHAQAGGAMGDFLSTSLSQLAQAAGVESGQQIENLDDEQLALLLDEAAIGVPSPAPGKLNLNTCTDEAIEYIPGIQPTLVDAIVYDRADRQTGYTSLVDLLEIDGMSRATLASLYPYVTVRSNVYVVASRGRDRATGVEVQIVATIDRSTLPVVIRELTIR